MSGNKITVIAVKNPFRTYDRDIMTVDWAEGERAAYYVAACRLPPDTEPAISINGEPAAPDAEVRPGDYIALCPVPKGGDSGKDVLRVVAMIAVMVVAAWAGATYGPMLAESAGITSEGGIAAMSVGVGAVVGTAGSLLMNAVLPPAKVDVPRIGSDAFAESPTYGWGPLRQTTVQGHAIPILYGTHRVAGQVLSQSIEINGDNQYLNMLLGVCHGPIDSISDIRINGQPAGYYKGVTTYARTGTLDDEVVPGFGEIVSQQDFGQKLGAVTHQTDGNAVEKIEVDIAAPYGCYYANDQGGLDTREAAFRVEYREAGATTWTLAGDYTISGATSRAIRKTVAVDDLSPAQYEVRVTRTNSESSSARERTTIYLVAMREIIRQALIYPGIAKYAVRALATDQLSGGIPSVSCLAARLTVDVYNPSSATWGTEDARNPAWAAYDLLVNHFGFGISHTRIIYEDFAAWASYCDEPVNGKPRFRINIFLDTQSDAWQALLFVCQIGRAIPVRRGTKYGVIIDRPGTPVQMFTMGNILQGSFRLSYLPQKDRANALEISYTDADRDYTRQVVGVYTDDYNDSTRPDNKRSMRLFGCTDRDQAIREAAYRLNATKWLARTIAFDADIDAIACQVGDLIYFQHDVPNYENDFSGRLKAATINTVVLDSEVTLQPGTTYAVLVRLADDTLVEKYVQPVDEETKTDILTLTTDFDAIPQEHDLYAFGEISSYKRAYRVTSITRSKKLARRVTAVEYIEDIYNDTGYAFENPAWETAYQETVQVYAGETLAWSQDGTYQNGIAVTWQPAVDLENYGWAVWLEDITSGTPAVRVGVTQGRDFLVPSSYLVPAHQYRVYVVGADQGPVEKNFYTAWAASTAYGLGDYVIPTHSNGHRYVCAAAGTSGTEEPAWPTGSGETVADGSVTWQEDGVSGNSTLITMSAKDATVPGAPTWPASGAIIPGFKVMGLRWNANTEIDLDSYEVERSSTGEFSGEETLLGRAYVHFFVDNDLAVNTQYWYRIRARDRSGNVSDWSTVRSAVTLQVGSADIAYNSILAAHINVSHLSAIAADIGTVTAGLAKSSDDKLQVDFNNKWIKVYDDQATPVLRVQLGCLP